MTGRTYGQRRSQFRRLNRRNNKNFRDSLNGLPIQSNALPVEGVYTAPTLPEYISSSTRVSSTPYGAFSIDPLVPAGIQNGDLMIMFVVEKDFPAGTAAEPTVATPSGWTRVRSLTVSGDTNNWLVGTVFSKVAGGSEPSSYNITGSSAEVEATIHRIQNSDRVDASSVYVTPNWDLGRQFSAIGVSEDNMLMLSFLFCWGAQSDSPAPSGWTSEYNYSDINSIWSKAQTTPALVPATVFNHAVNYELRGAITIALSGTVVLASTWTGSDGTATVTTTSGTFVSDQSWTGSSATATITSTSSSFTSSATWTGSNTTVTVTAASDIFTSSATWTGSNATVTVTAASDTFTSSATWTGSNTTVTVTAASDIFTSSATWTGSNATVTVTTASSEFTSGSTWIGSSGTISVATTSDIFTPGLSIWNATSGTVNINATSGSFSGLFVWSGSSANVSFSVNSGEFIGDSIWSGSPVFVNIVGSSLEFTSNVTWSGSLASIILSTTSGLFSSDVVWSSGSASILISPESSTFVGTEIWSGSTGEIFITTISGEFVILDSLWVGGNALITFSGNSSLFYEIIVTPEQILNYYEPKPTQYKENALFTHYEIRRPLIEDTPIFNYFENSELRLKEGDRIS